MLLLRGEAREARLDHSFRILGVQGAGALRIIGGALKGRQLVDWEESGIRPVRDLVRSALFNILTDFVSDSVCLDLFAGTGAVGLEALSRGAARCLFIDQSPAACGLIRRNLDALDLLEVGEVFEGSASEATEHFVRRGRRFDLVFIDPPYFKDLAPETLRALADGKGLTNDPVVVVASHKLESMDETVGVLSVAERRRYGDNLLWFYRRTEEGSDRGGE